MSMVEAVERSGLDECHDAAPESTACQSHSMDAGVSSELVDESIDSGGRDLEILGERPVALEKEFPDLCEASLTEKLCHRVDPMALGDHVQRSSSAHRIDDVLDVEGACLAKGSDDCLCLGYLSASVAVGTRGERASLARVDDHDLSG